MIQTRSPSPKPLSTLWIGPELTFLERACLRSAMACGHEVILYCYEPPAGIPSGVELRDAAEILPQSQIIRHRNGSPSLFSNRFRYELMHQGEATWIDCDLYFVAPLPHVDGYLMGEQGGGTINGAVLRLPADSGLLASLRELFEERIVPPWLAWRSRLVARWRLLTTGRSGLAQMPWGSAGPEALTWLAAKHGVVDRAQPKEWFYPVHWTEADWICNPSRKLDEMIGPETVAVHLWNERLKPYDLASAPAGSFAAQLRDEGALD